MITIFTSNQPRHMALANYIQKSSCQDVFVICEVPRLDPHIKMGSGQSLVFDKYFSLMKEAEDEIFATSRLFNSPNRVLSIPMYSVNDIDLSILPTDGKIITFGCSWIKGQLYEFIKDRAINIHMGISPYYRGASTNFWAMYNGHQYLVGATIQKLSTELDNGETIFYSFANQELINDPMGYMMTAANNAILDICLWLNGEISEDRLSSDNMEFTDIKERYFYKKEDFTVEVVSEFMKRYNL